MVCPNQPAYGQVPATYGANSSPMYVYNNAIFTSHITTANPSFPNPMQGECLCNCPFIAALASIAWVNRNFIIQNITPLPNTPPNNPGGSYTFKFWDYKGQTMPSSTDPTVPLNPVNGSGNPTGIPTYVTVSSQALFDINGSILDPTNTYYGAGSNYKNNVWPALSNEVWTALYERAYAKFCYYENCIKPTAGSLTCTKSTDQNGNPVNTITGPDPNIADVLSITKNPSIPQTQPTWGGNAGWALVYLTGLNCYSYNTNLSTFPTAPGGVNAATSIYNFINAGFCSEITAVQGISKTRYPLVAWTYPSGTQYDPYTLIADHCYAILGTYDASNGSSYIILRNTFGLPIPNKDYPLPSSLNVYTGGTNWAYNDAQFKIGSTPSWPANNRSVLSGSLNVALPSSYGIFAIEGTQAFKKYFATIGWAKGY
jgi:hypothetical protein